MERNLFPLREVIKKPQASKRKSIDTDKKKRKKWKANPTGLEAVTYIPLTYKKLTEGQIILGCVTEIRKYDMLISLPNQLTGKVPLTKICNAYTKCLKELAEGDKEDSEVAPLKDLFTPGQYVATKVFGFEMVNSERRVLLSLIPEDIHSDVPVSVIKVGQVLTCAVASVEDHGYIIETGISGVRGAFLPHSAAGGGNIVGVGGLLQCVVTKIDGNLNERSLQLYLSTDMNAIKKAAIPATSAVPLSLLLPGTVVKTHVTEVKDKMIKVALPEQDGVVGNMHLKKPLDVISQYDKGIDVKATVLYISAISKVVHLTLQDNIFLNRHNNPDLFHGYKVGDIIRDALVYKILPQGVNLQLKNSCRAYLPATEEKTFNIGEMVTCRIIKYAYMDNSLIVSSDQKYLEQQILSICELEVGMLIEGVIKFYNKEGAVVAINATQDGLIPFLLLTDTQLKNPELKYPVGTTLTCRVLRVDSESKRLYLTSRPHLVSLKDELLVKEYDSNLVGKLAEGYILSINGNGLVVGMFNDVKGFVPKSRATVEFVANLESLFSKGQIIRFRILDVDTDNSRMTLTLKIDGAPSVKHNVGDIVNGIIKEIKEEAIVVKLKASDRCAEIPTHHLVDDVSKSALVKSLLKKGDRIGNAVVFDCSNAKVTLTLKRTIHSWVTSSSKGTKQKFLKGKYYPAVVTDAYPDSLMVRTPVGDNKEKLKVEVPEKDLDEKDDPLYDVHAGETVWVKCLESEEQLHFVLIRLSFRVGVLRSIQPLYSYFRELRAIRDTMLKRGNDVEKQLAQIELGERYCVMVTKLCDEDIHVRLKDSDICGVIKNENRGPYQTVDIDQELHASVIHVDYETKSLEFSSLPHIVKRLHTKQVEKLVVGNKAHCEVLYKHQHYIMVMLKSRVRGLVAYMPPFKKPNFHVGKELRIVIEFAEDNLALVLPHKFADEGEGSVSKNGPYWALSGRNVIEHEKEIECATKASLKTFHTLVNQLAEREKIKKLNDKVKQLVELQREKQEMESEDKVQNKGQQAKDKQEFKKKDMKGKVARKAVAEKKAKAQLKRALAVEKGKAILKEALEEKQGKENMKNVVAKL